MKVFIQRPSFIIPLYHVLTSESLHHQNIKEQKTKVSDKRKRKSANWNPYFYFLSWLSNYMKETMIQERPKLVSAVLMNIHIFDSFFSSKDSWENIFLLNSSKKCPRLKFQRGKMNLSSCLPGPHLLWVKGDQKCPASKIGHRTYSW